MAMNDDQLAYLKALIETTGPSGYEATTQRVWRERVQGSAQDLWQDSLGNNIALLNPNGKPRVMIDAHIDELGFLIKYIDDNGFLYFEKIGGFDPSTLPGNRVRIMGKSGPVLGVLGRAPIHLMSPAKRKKAPVFKRMWIDIGARDRNEAESMVSVGDAGGRATGLQRMNGNLVTSNSIDDRVGCYVMSEAFRALAQTDLKPAVFAASSSQEEIGLRGARAGAYRVNAEIGLAIEVTHATDYPEMRKTERGDIRIGAGPVFTRGANINPRVFDLLVSAAAAEGVPYQVEADPGGTGTDGNVMQMTRSGMAIGLLSVPLRYMHTASEVISLDDVDASVKVVTRFVRDLDEGVDLVP
jgi:putative aminopeptidase FrvX